MHAVLHIPPMRELNAGSHCCLRSDRTPSSCYPTTVSFRIFDFSSDSIPTCISLSKLALRFHCAALIIINPPFTPLNALHDCYVPNCLHCSNSCIILTDPACLPLNRPFHRTVRRSRQPRMQIRSMTIRCCMYCTKDRHKPLLRESLTPSCDETAFRAPADCPPDCSKVHQC